MFKRNLYPKAKHLLTTFPALVILGARQCGKTTLAKTLAPDFKYVDLENADHLSEIQRDIGFYFENYPRHLIIDEAQLYPELFKRLRGVIDEDRQQMGRFILTGSSSPELLKNISESLAGRVAIIELSTLKMNERADVPLSAFYQIFENELNSETLTRLGSPSLTKLAIEKSWCYGGYPDASIKNQQDWAFWMTFYRDTYINRDIASLFPKLNKLAYQRFLSVLSQLSGTIINKSALARDIEVSEKSAREYLQIAEGTFLWRKIPAFEQSSLKSLVKMPKGYIRDSGLLNFLLRYHKKEALLASPYLGRLFESFVIEELLKGLDATFVADYNACYYRTRAGVEIDLILQGAFGILPIEIKFGVKVDVKQLRALEHFLEEQKLPFGLLINQSDEAKWLTRKVFQLPAVYL